MSVSSYKRPLSPLVTIGRSALVLFAILALVSCGGGGGSPAPPDPPPGGSPPITTPTPPDPPPAPPAPPSPPDPPPVVTPPDPPSPPDPPPVVTPPDPPSPPDPPPVVTPPDPPSPPDPPPVVTPPDPPPQPTNMPPGALVPAPASFDCALDATAADGTVYAVDARHEPCVQHLRRALHDALATSQIPDGSKGRTILLDIFWDFNENPEASQGFRDGSHFSATNGVPYTTDGTWPVPIGTRIHGRNILNEWRRTTPDGIEPQAWVGPRYQFIGSGALYSNFTFRASDAAEAWKAAVADNPLFTNELQAENLIAVLNYSQELSAQFAWELQDERDNAQARGWTVGDQTFDFLLVAAAGNGRRTGLPTSAVGIPSIRPQQLSFESRSDLRSNNNGALRTHYPTGQINDPEGSVILDEEVDNYLVGLSSEVLQQIADLDDPEPPDLDNCVNFFACIGLRKTGVFNFDSILTGLSTSLRQKLSEVHEQTILVETVGDAEESVLKFLARLILLSRSNDLVYVSHLNEDGDDRSFAHACSVARISCLFLQYSDSTGRAGTSQATARLTPIIDSIWLLWPSLSKAQLLSVLFGCTEDRGEAGIDRIYGQGVLTLNPQTDRCIFSPTGGLRDPRTGSTASGALRIPGVAETAYTAIDDVGRDFSYAAVSTDLNQTFSPTTSIAVALHNGDRTLWTLGASDRHWSLWASSAIARHLWIQYGMTFEPEGLMGARGTESFVLADGRSAFAALTWAKSLTESVNVSAYVRVVHGTAYGNGYGLVRRLDLDQEVAGLSLNIEPSHLQTQGRQMGLYLSATCDSGTSGQLELVSAESALKGVTRCNTSVAARMRF